MKYAKGTAITMHSTETITAMNSVRPMMRRYVGLRRALKFSVVNVGTTSLVNGSVVKNAVAKIATRAPR